MSSGGRTPATVRPTFRSLRWWRVHGRESRRARPPPRSRRAWRGPSEIDLEPVDFGVVVKTLMNNVTDNLMARGETSHGDSVAWRGVRCGPPRADGGRALLDTADRRGAGFSVLVTVTKAGHGAPVPVERRRAAGRRHPTWPLDIETVLDRGHRCCSHGHFEPAPQADSPGCSASGIIRINPAARSRCTAAFQLPGRDYRGELCPPPAAGPGRGPQVRASSRGVQRQLPVRPVRAGAPRKCPGPPGICSHSPRRRPQLAGAGSPARSCSVARASVSTSTARGAGGSHRLR